MKILFFILLLFLVVSAYSQNVGIGLDNPHPSAKLEVSSTNSGFLPPRMTYAQRNAISNPAQGLIVYCTDCLPKGEVQVFNGTEWTNMTGIVAQYVTIGTQVWSTKNLDATTYRNGDPIPQVTNSTQWANLTTGAWCWYNNDSATYAATYGKLYNWYAVNDPRGLAPYGWHIPTDPEWNIMTKYLDPTVDTTCQCWSGVTIGTQLKSSIEWINNGNGINSSGFAGLPGGWRYTDGTFNNIGSNGRWWTASTFCPTCAWYRFLGGNTSNIDRYYPNKLNGFSVRIVKD